MNTAQRVLAATVTSVGGFVGSVRTFTQRFVTRTSWGVSTLLGRTRIDYANEVGDASKNSIVVAVVGWVARNFPEAPVRIRRLNPDGSAEVIQPASAGPGYMLRLLERPNPYFSGVLQWIATVVDLFSTGNAYWIKLRLDMADPNSRVMELWWVPKKFMRPAWDENGRTFISYYIYRIDGIDYRIETWNVVHFRDGINPDNPREGLSRLASLFREIYTDDEAANFSAVLLKNLGVPGVVLAPANTTTGTVKADTEQIKTAFMDKFGGDRRGEPLVLSAPTSVTVLSFSPAQMNLKELRRIPEERVSAVTGVPAGVAGLGAGLDRNTFTNYSEARRAAYQEAIGPLQRLISAELEVQLLDDFADVDVDPLDVDFDTSKASALQEALDAVWKRYESSATKGLLTRAAFKQAVGQPVTEEDDVYVYPNNYNVVGIGGPVVTPVPAPPVFRGQAQEVRCQNPECHKLLAEAATAPYRFTCFKCKTVTEAGDPERPMLTIVGARYEYDEEGRLAATYDIPA